MDVLVFTHRAGLFAPSATDLAPTVHMRVTRSVEAARGALGRRRYDIVVADDALTERAAAVMALCQETTPSAYRVLVADTVRLRGVLEGHASAHQIVSPRGVVVGLRAAVARATEFQTLVGELRTRDLLGGFGSLPAVPAGFQRIMDVMSDPDCTPDDVARVLEQSISVSAKLLQLVNSAMMGLPRRVTSVRQAVHLLGLRFVRALVLSSEASGAFRVERPLVGFSAAGLERHSVLVATLARAMTSGADAQADAFTAGMLHDVGRLMLASRFPQQYSRVMLAAQQPGQHMEELERRMLGIGHSELGGYLLALWGLPEEVVEAVIYHHAPSHLPHGRPAVVDVLHVAEALAHEVEPQDYLPGELDLDHLGGAEVDRLVAVGRAALDRLRAA